ncbi:MAG: hypothetical protein AMXMBFR13_06210 [Phycisphaerae bacterium]
MGAGQQSLDELKALSLLELVRRIVNGDRAALRELHGHRTPFSYGGRQSLRLAEYLEILRTTPLARRWTGGRADAIDRAYDLTIDKFTNLPSSPSDGDPPRSAGPDCRLYFEAFLRRANSASEASSQDSQLQEESVLAGILQGLVTRHFYLSCLEARRRSNPLVSRYFWHRTVGSICVWMPAHLSGSERRDWLENHIEDPDPKRASERERVQAVVDQQLILPQVFSLEDPNEMIDAASLPSGDTVSQSIEDGVQANGLAETVAQEKADRIHDQRPAIREMGASSLKTMILQIFDELSQGRFDAAGVARRFGLTKPTMSRFAGTSWMSSSGTKVPDLWVNTAETLARHRTFMDAARRAGVWPRVENALEAGRSGARSIDHG